MSRNKTDWRSVKISHNGHDIHLYAPADPPKMPLPIIYSMSGDAMPEEIERMRAELRKGGGEPKPFIAASFEPFDWNHSFSPWDAPPLHGDSPFTGGARETLDLLLHSVRPVAEEYLPVSQAKTGHMLLGYSLSALFALWAMYACDDFGAAACCSPSLWFDGWMDYMRANHPCADSRIYLSLGRKEEKTRNRRLASVGDAAREASDLLQDDPRVVESRLEWHDGGHTHEVVRRMAQALAWLLKAT